jgi:hypothetical protein
LQILEQLRNCRDECVGASLAIVSDAAVIETRGLRRIFKIRGGDIEAVSGVDLSVRRAMQLARSSTTISATRASSRALRSWRCWH